MPIFLVIVIVIVNYPTLICIVHIRPTGRYRQLHCFMFNVQSWLFRRRHKYSRTSIASCIFDWLDIYSVRNSANFNWFRVLAVLLHGI